MALTTTTTAHLADHLRAVGVRAGMGVCVHSRLLSFGRIDGGAEAVLAALAEVVGPSGTIVVPTYTLGLRADDIYDPKQTPPQKMGVLSDYLAFHPQAGRGWCPMHNHAAIGARGALMGEADETRSIGPGSSFDRLMAAGFHLLLLGCGLHEGGTFVHHVEACEGVPYRLWLDLPRRVRRADGRVDDIRCRYYGRDPAAAVTNDLHQLHAMAEADGLLSSSAAPYGRSHLIALGDLYDYVARALQNNPLLLTKS